MYILDLNNEVQKWHFLCNLPVQLCSHSSCIVGNKLYVYGGTNGVTFFDSVSILDLKTLTWKNLVEEPV